jgi:uncharacterized protein
MKNIFRFFTHLPKRIAVILIGLYQALLSPDHSWLKFLHPYGYCKYYPTCSQYAKEAIEQFGLISGGFLAIKRVISCHPWARPKVDPIPKTFSFWNKR